MRRLSIFLPAIALALVLVLSGSTTPFKAAATPAPAKANYQVFYYWYTYPGDAFVDNESVAIEELEYLVYHGWLVNTDPRGGTLISRGYLNNNFPHTVNPSAFLYRH
jgi:hypothetical protein